MPESVDDLPVGPALPDWKPCDPPSREPMVGRYCRLEPLDPARHAQALHIANQSDKAGRNWTFLSYGPFESFDENGNQRSRLRVQSRIV